MDASDAADDCAGEVIGVRDEGGLGIGGGAEMSGEDAGGDPEGGDGKREKKVSDAAAWSASGVAEGDGGDAEKKGGGEEKEGGGMRIESGEELSDSEAEGGKEQRGTAKAERLDGRGIVGEESGVGCGAGEWARRSDGAIAEADARGGIEWRCGRAGGHQRELDDGAHDAMWARGGSALRGLYLIGRAILDAMKNRDCFLMCGLGKHVNQMELGEVVAGG